LRDDEAEDFGVLEVDDELEPRPPLAGRPTGAEKVAGLKAG
jgi:hypothetical protein